jgi:hypothetical protein
MPGLIFKRACKALGIPVVRKKFRTVSESKIALDQRLEAGQPVGCQVGVYYLTYFPKEYRFHFNAHNIVVFGKEGDNYLVSDPVMEYVTSLSDYELERVRWAKGALAPKGQIYYPLPSSEQVTDERIVRAIRKGIRSNAWVMLNIPGHIAGVSGIKYTGRKIKKWKDQLGLHTAGLYLAQLVRMQEEIGTGGGGFRYMYAAFLQQAMAYTPNDTLPEATALFTQAGDLWRSAAVQAAGIYKGRLQTQGDFNQMGDYLLEIAEVERKAFTALSKIKWTS